MTFQTVILAAGMGSRLGRSLPKPLTELNDGRSIMQQQHDNIRAAFGDQVKITTVVGYRAETIVEAFPDVDYVYNDRYDQTNTSKSLLRALNTTGKSGVLWMNGDVVFDPRVLGRAIELIERDQSFVTVNTSKVSDEEVKYTMTAGGLHQRALEDRQGRHRRSRRHQLHLERRQEGVHPPARPCRRPGLLRARPRARDRRGRAPARAARHLGPLRGRGRLRRGPRAGEPLRLILSSPASAGADALVSA